MTVPEMASLDLLDEAVGAAAPKLGPDERRLAMVVYRLLALGEPVGVSAAAQGAVVSPEWAEETVTSWPAVFFDDSKRVVGFWGLALGETPHRLRCGEVPLHAWCGWDPLFLARIIGTLDVSTNDPMSAEEITYRVGADGRIAALSHADSVLSFLRPDRSWDDEVRTHFCHYIWHFAWPRTAEIWTAQHPGTFILGLDQATELARRHVERAFSDHLGRR